LRQCGFDLKYPKALSAPGSVGHGSVSSWLGRRPDVAGKRPLQQQHIALRRSFIATAEPLQCCRNRQQQLLG